MLKGILFFLSFTLLGLFGEEPLRVWTSKDGRTLEARFVEQIDESIKIRLSNGRLFSVPLNRFSSGDQEYVQQLIKNRKQLVSRKPDQFYLEDDDWEGYLKGGAIVLSISGEVWVKEGQSDFIEDYENIRPPKWRFPRIGEVLMVGYQINTRQTGILDLLLTNGTVIRFQPNSEVYIKTYFQELITTEPILTLEEFDQEISPSMVKFRIDVGEMIVDTKKLDKKSSFYIESRLGVSGIRGTAFRLKVINDAQQLEVLYGQVDTLYQQKKLVPLLNNQVSEFKDEGTSTIRQLSEGKISEISEICTILNDKSSAARIDYLLEKQEEANPPFVLRLDENGFEYAMRQKIRRKRGRILQEDYDRVGKIYAEKKRSVNLSNLDFLENLTELTHLSLNQNTISDIEPVIYLQKLEFLNLHGARIQDYSPVSKLIDLEKLTVGTNKISNFFGMKNLAVLRLRAGFDFKLLENFPNLKQLGVHYMAQSFDYRDFESLGKLEQLLLTYGLDYSNPFDDRKTIKLNESLPTTEILIKQTDW